MKSKSLMNFKHAILLIILCFVSGSNLLAEDSIVRSKNYNNFYSIKYFDSTKTHYKTEVYSSDDKLSSYYTFSFIRGRFRLDSIFLVNDSGQISSKEYESIYSLEDYIANLYKNGEEAFYQFISENLEYPKYCVDRNLKGQVEVEFYISREGLLVCIFSNTKKVDELLIKESNRIILISEGKWIIDAKKYQYGVMGKIPFIFEIIDSNH